MPGSIMEARKIDHLLAEIRRRHFEIADGVGKRHTNIGNS